VSNKSLLVGFARGIAFIPRSLARGLIRDDARGEPSQRGPLGSLFGRLVFLGRNPLGFQGSFAFTPFGALAGELLQFGGGPLGLSDFSRLSDCLSLALTS
jgi:hypothetical protein